MLFAQTPNLKRCYVINTAGPKWAGDLVSQVVIRVIAGKNLRGVLDDPPPHKFNAPSTRNNL